jgi:translation elongation factor EF-1beta
VFAREKLTMLMEESQCVRCHRKIDPIGFGLQNFNVVGLWRENEVGLGSTLCR